MLRLRSYPRDATPALIATNTATNPWACSRVNCPAASAARTDETAWLTARFAAAPLMVPPIAPTAFETAVTTPAGTFDALNVLATASAAA